MWEIGTGLFAKRYEDERESNKSTEIFNRRFMLCILQNIIRYTKFVQINGKEKGGTFSMHEGYEKYTLLFGNDGSRTTWDT
jgi:hypothetical protein